MTRTSLIKMINTNFQVLKTNKKARMIFNNTKQHLMIITTQTKRKIFLKVLKYHISIGEISRASFPEHHFCTIITIIFWYLSWKQSTLRWTVRLGVNVSQEPELLFILVQAKLQAKVKFCSRRVSKLLCTETTFKIFVYVFTQIIFSIDLIVNFPLLGQQRLKIKLSATCRFVQIVKADI